MVYYLEAFVSMQEVPHETSLLIFISGCKNHCPNCHYPELQRTDYGSSLMEQYQSLVDIYFHRITCICFLGEGSHTQETKHEFKMLCAYAAKRGLKTCLYSGRDCMIEPWMHCFDYIKVGSYDAKRGPLTSKTTNQRFYQKTEKNTYVDKTELFWVET